MKRVNNCVICGGQTVTRKHGAVAPFLARRIWDGKPPSVDLVECQACSFLFFNPRLEPEEEQRLYTAYRLEEYQRARQACEPWYTAAFNASVSDLSFSRRDELRRVLKPFVAGIQNPRILDFGGDRGQLIHDLIPGASGYVYDISDVTPLEGIRRCASLDECRSEEFDLIVCSNVLEHVGFPRTIMDQIMGIAGRQTLVFIEVPFESPFGITLELRRLAQLAVLSVTRPSVALSLAKPGFLYVMHEHINYYNKKSLEALMTASGGAAVASDAYVIESKMGKATLGWCLGRVAAVAA